MTFQEAATFAGYCRWFESRLFEVVGAWVGVEDEPSVKLAFRAHSFQHGRHAEIWRERLPVVGSPDPAWDPAALTAPADDAVAALVDALARPADPSQTIERLVGVYRVALPHLVALYGDRLERASPTSDGPTIRSLRHILADELDAWREGERLLQPLLRTRADVERASSHQVALESCLL